MLKFMMMASFVVGRLMSVPVWAEVATPDSKQVPLVAPSAGVEPRVSPYAIAARQRAQAGSATAHVAALPPSLRHTRQAISQVPPH